MERIIDFHTHAFPDWIAEKAIRNIQLAGQIEAHHDGTLSGLLRSMDKSGILKSVVCSIATKPSQFDSILNWSQKIRSERIEPFPSFHPEDPLAIEHIKQIKQEGFLGIKIHPYYQDFFVDGSEMMPLYETIADAGLILVIHAGYDFAFPRFPRANPGRFARVIEKIPHLKIIATHMGGWQQWDEVERFLVGKSIFFETSFSLDIQNQEEIQKIIIKHSPEMTLFGSDSPWADQSETLKLFRHLQLSEQEKNLILFENARKLLGLD